MPINKRYGFGTRGIIPADTEESRVIPFVLSTFNKDRHGTVLNQDNWNLESYRANPVIAYQHTLSGGMCTDPNPDYVIGKSLAIGIEGNGIDKRLVADAQFEPADVNPLAEKIFRKVLFGSLSRSSVGFMEVGEGKYGIGEEAEGRSEETYYFAGQELLEWSVVNIPSNPQAGKRDITMRRMREEGYIAFMYAFRELGGRFRLSEIENMTVRDILTLLDGKDLEIKEKDPEVVRAILNDPQTRADAESRMREYMITVTNSLKG
jgi:hypothetical protein